MNSKNIFKSKLQNKKQLIGSWISIAHPAIAEIMANAGFDWLAIDLEHSVITIKEAEELIRVINLSGVTPLVRLTSNNSDQIKRVMDAGSHGIIVPMVNTEEEARIAVSATKYPPTGSRGVGLARAQKYGASFNNYLNWQKDNSVVIVQIEHIEAVNNLKGILSVEGVDGFIVGPYDLSGSMGVPGDFDNANFKNALKKIKKISEKSNVPGGIHVVEPNPKEISERLKEGYNFLAYSVDIRMLDVACRSGLEIINNV